MGTRKSERLTSRRLGKGPAGSSSFMRDWEALMVPGLPSMSLGRELFPELLASSLTLWAREEEATRLNSVMLFARLV